MLSRPMVVMMILMMMMMTMMMMMMMMTMMTMMMTPPVWQLHALVELVGPVGIEIIDVDILAYIRDRLREIKAFIDANRAVRVFI
jgi:hypothetical protein